MKLMKLNNLIMRKNNANILEIVIQLYYHVLAQLYYHLFHYILNMLMLITLHLVS